MSFLFLDFILENYFFLKILFFFINAYQKISNHLFTYIFTKKSDMKHIWSIYNTFSDTRTSIIEQKQGFMSFSFFFGIPFFWNIFFENFNFLFINAYQKITNHLFTYIFPKKAT